MEQTGEQKGGYLVRPSAWVRGHPLSSTPRRNRLSGHIFGCENLHFKPLSFNLASEYRGKNSGAEL